MGVILEKLGRQSAYPYNRNAPDLSRAYVIKGKSCRKLYQRRAEERVAARHDGTPDARQGSAIRAPGRHMALRRG
jgi:hypothetical protein